MKSYNLALLSLSVCILTACGGGGTGMTTATQNASGSVTKFHEDSNGNLIITALTSTSDDRDTLVVDGQTITLIPAGAPNEAYYQNASKTMIVSNNLLNYSRFGAYIANENTVDETTYVFAIGTQTPLTQMPSSGSATYTGYSRYDYENSGAPYEGIEGTSSFTVDFGNNTLSGEVAGSGYTTIPIKATISGNSFSGIASGSNPNVSGHFFGPNAAELSGSFYDEKSSLDPFGAFGAIKQ